MERDEKLSEAPLGSANKSSTTTQLVKSLHSSFRFILEILSNSIILLNSSKGKKKALVDVSLKIVQIEL